MNTELVNQAMEKVRNPYILVNLISRRVRQLNGAGGRTGRPLIPDTGNLSAGDTALREIIEDKIGFETPPISKLIRPAGQNRARPHGWVKVAVSAINVAA